MVYFNDLKLRDKALKAINDTLLSKQEERIKAMIEQGQIGVSLGRKFRCSLPIFISKKTGNSY